MNVEIHIELKDVRSRYVALLTWQMAVQQLARELPCVWVNENADVFGPLFSLIFDPGYNPKKGVNDAR